METQNKRHVKLLMYSGSLLLIVLSILAIAATVFVAKGNRSYDENTISIKGESEIDAQPDIAVFSFNVTEQAKTTDIAQEAVTEKISKILVSLDAAGVEKEDIKTQSYSITPKYEWVKIQQKQQETSVDGLIYYPGEDKKSVQTGFNVSQRVELTVRDLDIVGELLVVLGTEGVQNLNGPNFKIEDPAALEEKVRALAIKDAKIKAKRLAKDLDVRLGKVVSFNENNGGYVPQKFYGRSLELASFDVAATKASPEIPVGENTIRSSVTISYRIK